MDFSTSSVFDQHKGKSLATNFKIHWSKHACCNYKITSQKEYITFYERALI